MTPMIDVVFLLLTFFVLTLNIVIPEGDFNIRMSATGQAQPVEIDSDSVQVRLIADAEGRLAVIQLDDKEIESFDLLRQQVSAIARTKPDLEVVLCTDDHLRYEYLVRAITTVSGEFHEGQIRKICENIKFARQRVED